MMWLKFNKIVSNIHSLEEWSGQFLSRSEVWQLHTFIVLARLGEFVALRGKNDKCPSNARCRKSVGRG